MTLLHSMLHPTFDALSAHADRSDLAAARTRVGRHVAGCGECSAVVTEIRALGTAAREIPEPALPPRLWARIEAAPRVDHDVPEAPSASRTSIEGVRRRWPWMAAAAAVVASVLFVPFGRSAEATSPSRLQFSPARPRPGGTITVRYRAAPWLAGAPRLVLVGRWLGDPGRTLRTEAFDSLGTLRRASDGSYVGRLALPADFRAAHLLVADSTGAETDADGARPWSVIGGTVQGAPALASLVAASATGARLFWGNDGSGRQRVDVGDSLRRHFPSHPLGWAERRPGQSGGSAFDRLVAYFERGEKKYAQLAADLAAQPRVDADRLVGMARLAGAIDEPLESTRWAVRLATEHPADARALPVLATALHALELNSVRGAADSIRASIPLMDRTYLAAPEQARLDNDLLALVERNAGGDVYGQWLLRAAERRPLGWWARAVQRDTTARRLVLARAQRLANDAGACATRRFGPPSIAWFGDDCVNERRIALGIVAQELLQTGDARGARAMVNRADALPGPGATCGRRSHPEAIYARAHLAEGDTAGALRALAEWERRQGGAARDSVRRWLGPRAAEAEAPTYRRLADSTAQAAAACWERFRRRSQERARALAAM